MSARIFQFPPRPGLTVEAEFNKFREALKTWKEMQERERRTAEQLKGYEAYGRNRGEPEPPEAA